MASPTATTGHGLPNLPCTSSPLVTRPRALGSETDRPSRSGGSHGTPQPDPSATVDLIAGGGQIGIPSSMARFSHVGPSSRAFLLGAPMLVKIGLRFAPPRSHRRSRRHQYRSFLHLDSPAPAATPGFDCDSPSHHFQSSTTASSLSSQKKKKMEREEGAAWQQ